nr:hypothetical protein [Tanacetum cinerariifolium]
MEIPDTMISDAIKKSSGYKFYIAKKKESGKDKIVVKPEEQHVSLIKSGREKRFLCYGDQAVNVPKKDVVPRKTRSLTIAKEIVLEERENETDDVDYFDMDLSDDNPQGDDDAARFVAQKFKEYDQKLEALFNASEAFEKAVEARVLTYMKKLLPTHILKFVANYVRPRLNTSVLDIMKINQSSLFTKPSTSTDDLSDMDLNLKLMNRIYESKSNTTHPSNQKLYDTLYESVCLDHDAVDAPDAEPSFHKRAHDNQDPLNNREGENRKKYRKDVAKKLKAIIQKDELTIADLVAVLTKAKWNSDEDEVSKPRTFERHMSKNIKPHPSFYNNDLYYLVYLIMKEKYTTSIPKHYATRYYKQSIEYMISGRWSKETHCYIFEALNGIYRWKTSIIDFFKVKISTRTERNGYSDLRIKSFACIVVKKKRGYGFLTSIVVRRSDDNESGKLSTNSQPTKPLMFFEGVDQRIPFTMTTKHKGVVYLNQKNVKSLIRLSEVKKFCDGTLEKIQENLIDMVTKNKLGKGNKRLKGRQRTDDDVVKSNEMIDKTFKCKEQLKRLEEYVGGKPKTVNPRTFAYDNPNMFITSTYNPKRPEIAEMLTYVLG